MIKKDKAKGMTLIELIVVLTIISMTSTFYAISTHWIDRIKLENKAQEIVATIEYAKQVALLTGKSHILQIKEQSFIVIQTGELHNIMVAEVKLDKNQVLTHNTKTKILINHNGAINQSTTLFLKCPSLKEQIRITIGVATSKVRVYRENK